MLLGTLRRAFSQDRLFVRVCRQAIGVLCALGTRTVARVLAATGRDQCDWSTEYRLFSRSPWKSREVFLPIIKAALEHAPAQGPIVLTGDFTHLPHPNGGGPPNGLRAWRSSRCFATRS